MCSGSRPSLEGTRLLFLFAGGAVGPMTCPADGQQRDDIKAGRKKDRPRRGQRQPKKTVDSKEVEDLFASCLGVIRCDIA